jgi:hypothetical protein
VKGEFDMAPCTFIGREAKRDIRIWKLAFVRKLSPRGIFIEFVPEQDEPTSPYYCSFRTKRSAEEFKEAESWRFADQPGRLWVIEGTIPKGSWYRKCEVGGIRTVMSKNISMGM